MLAYSRLLLPRLEVHMLQPACTTNVPACVLQTRRCSSCSNYYSRQALNEAFRREDGSYEPGYDEEHSYLDFHAMGGLLRGPALKYCL